jgi:hypothetical protein
MIVVLYNDDQCLEDQVNELLDNQKWNINDDYEMNVNRMTFEFSLSYA